MDIKIKILVAVLPFIIAGYVGFSMLQPALDEASTKENSLVEKRAEKEKLDGQLKDQSQISKRREELTQEIEKLRGSVPKAADTELLTIDLERMCKDAGMNMVGLVPVKEDQNPARPKSTDVESKQSKLKNALKGNIGGGDAQSAGEAQTAGAELEESRKQFIVTGDFNGLEKLVNELETYQRVVKIDNITFRVPKRSSEKDKVKIDDSQPAEGEEVGDPRLLFATMSITTYYLP